MRSARRITSLRFTSARTGGGLLGWASFILDGDLAVDGMAVRRTLLGELALGWPARKDAAGRLHHHLRPVHAQARRELECELLRLLRPMLRGGA